MAIIIYDGSYEGLLSAIHTCVTDRIDVTMITDQHPDQSLLFAEEIQLNFDYQAMRACLGRIKNRLPARSNRHIFYTFLSNQTERAQWIYEYILYGLQAGKQLDEHITDTKVARVLDISRKVGCEAHRMHGLVRFAKLGCGMYYARIRPDHNILPIIGKHFAQRFADQIFMIHDVGRNTALLYDKRSWYITPVEVHYDPELADDEVFYQKLWQQYFDSIAIQERTNPRLQKQFMPKRYWEFLVEMQR